MVEEEGKKDKGRKEGRGRRGGYFHIIELN